ncbi:MAG: type II toxin-antitoxin system VapC family toxin [Zhaonellaceae bacterium]|jgi:predicted nucleic acid-binding protein|nr:type II toxin-antitoxin system VapC family toxin [Clostridia bacterium]
MKAPSVFIDTGAFYALIDRDDPYHVAAYKQWAELLQQKYLLYITNYIVGETYTLLRYRLGWDVACKFLDVIEECSKLGRIRIKTVPSKTEQYARDLLRSLANEDLSYIDAISIATIRMEKIPLAFSFDGHFQLAQAEVIP